MAHIVKKYNFPNKDIDELISIGTVGLIKAIDNFDLNFDVKFSTYAFTFIIGEISKYVRENQNIKVSATGYYAIEYIELVIDGVFINSNDHCIPNILNISVISINQEICEQAFWI